MWVPFSLYISISFSFSFYLSFSCFVDLFFSFSYFFHVHSPSLSSHTHILFLFHNCFSACSFCFWISYSRKCQKYFKWMMTYWKHAKKQSFWQSAIHSLSQIVFEFWPWIIVFIIWLGNMTPVKQRSSLPAKLYFVDTKMPCRGLKCQSALASGCWQQDKIGN